MNKKKDFASNMFFVCLIGLAMVIFGALVVAEHQRIQRIEDRVEFFQKIWDNCPPELRDQVSP